MLVYDITNAKTFDNISKWLRNIDEVSSFLGFFFLSLPLSRQMSPWHEYALSQVSTQPDMTSDAART